MILTCDRCLRSSAVLVPWTRDLNSNRIILRCCLDCEEEQTHSGHEVYRADCEACASELAAYLG